jgi:hypothetical protein
MIKIIILIQIINQNVMMTKQRFVKCFNFVKEIIVKFKLQKHVLIRIFKIKIIKAINYYL